MIIYTINSWLIQRENSWQWTQGERERESYSGRLGIDLFRVQVKRFVLRRRKWMELPQLMTSRDVTSVATIGWFHVDRVTSTIATIRVSIQHGIDVRTTCPEGFDRRNWTTPVNWTTIVHRTCRLALASLPLFTAVPRAWFRRSMFSEFHHARVSCMHDAGRLWMNAQHIRTRIVATFASFAWAGCDVTTRQVVTDAYSTGLAGDR